MTKKSPHHKSHLYLLSGVEFEGEDLSPFKNGIQRQDDLIENEIKQYFLNNPVLNSDEISFSVLDGQVKITGTVESFFQRKKIHDKILAITGVNEIIDHLEVKN
jgi:osmotically-inducible protein OsmY